MIQSSSQNYCCHGQVALSKAYNYDHSPAAPAASRPGPPQPFSITLMCTASHQTPASASTNQGPPKGNRISVCFFITLEPKVEGYTSVWALNTTPPRKCFTFLRGSCFNASSGQRSGSRGPRAAAWRSVQPNIASAESNLLQLNRNYYG